MTTVKNIYDYINSIAPYDTQEEWDNSGHLVGDFRKEVKKAVLALDATKAVCAFSADIGADLVITHHPIIFGGIKSVKSDTAVYSLASSGIAHLCAHTNFDLANGGINDNLAEILDLQNTRHIDSSFLVVGDLESPMSIDDFAALVAEKLNCAVFDISIPTKLFHPLQSAAELAVNISTLLFKMPIALSPAI